MRSGHAPVANDAERRALAWIESLQCAWLLLDRGCRILYCNRFGRAEFAHVELMQHADTLRVTRADGQAVLEQLVATCCSNGKSVCIQSVSPSGHVILHARVVDGEDEDAVVALSWHASWRSDPHGYADLQTTFRLTAGEHSVLDALLTGHSAESIASSRRTSIETVRKQIRGIYTKLGVSSREAMFARLRRYRTQP